jgi:hypothetical protein
VLFDFADLDSWWFNPVSEEWEHSTYDYDGSTVPVEHPQFNGSEAGHTTYESCEQKGRAVWWMMARLAGWELDPAGLDNKPADSNALFLGPACPSPFASSTCLNYALSTACRVRIAVFDVTGRLVRILARGDSEAQPGLHTITWDGTDIAGRPLPSGVYYIRLSTPGEDARIGKAVLLK